MLSLINAKFEIFYSTCEYVKNLLFDPQGLKLFKSFYDHTIFQVSMHRSKETILEVHIFFISKLPIITEIP